MTLTSEQAAVVTRLKSTNRSSVKVIAYAGTGKTSTLEAVCRALPERRILNMSFNRSVADEASSRFPDNTVCETFHGVAYAKTQPVTLCKTPKEFVDSMITLLGINPFAAWGGYRTLIKFCETDSEQVLKEHAHNDSNLEKFKETLTTKNLDAVFADAASSMWNYYLEHPESLALHCMYLKKFTLGPDILSEEFDLVIVDEAQDANPAMLSILRKLSCQILIVGDPYQQIYEFNGAINALDAFEFETMYLTRSFRWGHAVAELSNLILGHTTKFNPDHPIKGDPGIDTTVDMFDYTDADFRDLDAVITRTNMECFKAGMLLKDRGIPYNFTNRESALQELGILSDLRRDWPEKRSYAGCRSWMELKNYVSEAKAELPNSWIILGLDNGHASQIHDFLDNSRNYGITLTTAHRAKGLEWNNVLVTGGFLKGYGTVTEEEFRLFYVACTRSKMRLSLPWDLNGISRMLKDLKEYQAALRTSTKAQRAELMTGMKEKADGRGNDLFGNYD